MKVLKTLSIILLALAILAQGCSASKEKGTFTDFYKKHKKKDGFVSFNIPPGLIGLFLSKEEKELKQFLKGIDDIKILIYENNPDSSKYFASVLKESLMLGLYNDLMVINEGSDKVEFKIRETENKVNELIMVASDSSSLVVLSIEGEIELDKVKELSKSIDVKGVKQLDKVQTSQN